MSVQYTHMSVVDLNIVPTSVSPFKIVPESGGYGDAFLLSNVKPISLQSKHGMEVDCGVQMSVPQPVETVGSQKVASPYHIRWKAEPILETLVNFGVMVYGSSCSSPDLKVVLYNFGDKIYNAPKGTILARLQFYLVPNLQIKG